MANRLEIELTSKRDDDTWTWRAAGARQPRGVLDAALVPDGASVGDQLRAEAEITLDGITILSLSADTGRREREVETIEIIGSGRDEPLVTTKLAARSDERGKRRPKRRADRRDGDERRGRPERGGGAERGRRDGATRGSGGREQRPDGARRPDRPARGRPKPKAAPLPARPKAKRLRPGTAHRDALLASLSDEQRPVAEQLFRGGLPAVRAAIREQNDAARREGQPELPTEPLVAIAEELHGRVRTADWLDRAEAAVTDLRDLSLRDLRSVVTAGEDVARDDTTRALADALRDGLRQRLERAAAEWVEDVEAALAAGRVVRALRVSGRPNDPKHRLPTELLARLRDEAGQALASDVAPDRWAVVLDAVSFSPVRREVAPSGVPADPPASLLDAVTKAAQRCPGVAKAFGIDLTAPPGTAGRRPVPPPPTATSTPSPTEPASGAPQPGEAMPDAAPDGVSDPVD